MIKVEIWGYSDTHHEIKINGVTHLAPTKLVWDYFLAQHGEYSWPVVRAFLQDLEDLKNGL